MQVFGRNDAALIGALAVALFVMVSAPLGNLIEYVRGIEQLSGLRLLPGLIVLVTAFVLQQFRKRHEMQTAAALATGAVKTATERAAEMERLVTFGQALALYVFVLSLCLVFVAHIPLLAPGRGAWVMLSDPADPEQGEGKGIVWRTLTVIGDSSAASRERAARRALGELAVTVSTPDHDISFPMIIAGRPIGVLGVSPRPSLSEHSRGVLAAAGALLAVSLKNAELFREVRENSVRDQLTGCYRRAHALEVLENELRRGRRSHLPVTAIMFDLDGFKTVNDTCGHLAGDAVLTAVGARMRAVFRGSDLKCRYGGDEFLVVLPDTQLDGARRGAESLRRDLEMHPVKSGDGEIRISASFGVATSLPGEVDALTLVARADTALYTAKQNGRNCVRTLDTPDRLSAEQSFQTV